MSNEITRRDALVLGVSAAALAATGATAQTASTIKAVDVPAPKLDLEKGASLRMLRPVRFVKPDEDVFRANAAKFTEKTGVEVKVDFVGWEDINQQTAVTYALSTAGVTSTPGESALQRMPSRPKTVAVSLNTAHVARDDEARRFCEAITKETGLVCTDPVRFGADALVIALD
jgi:hypothetical protein